MVYCPYSYCNYCCYSATSYTCCTSTSSANSGYRGKVLGGSIGGTVAGLILFVIFAVLCYKFKNRQRRVVPRMQHQRQPTHKNFAQISNQNPPPDSNLIIISSNSEINFPSNQITYNQATPVARPQQKLPALGNQIPSYTLVKG